MNSILNFARRVADQNREHERAMNAFRQVAEAANLDAEDELTRLREQYTGLWPESDFLTYAMHKIAAGQR